MMDVKMFAASSIEALNGMPNIFTFFPAKYISPIRKRASMDSSKRSLFGNFSARIA